MPVSANYRPFIVDTILSFLQSGLGGAFKMYFFGDPIDIASQQMPCIIVAKERGSIEVGPTGMDENTEEIVITVVVNKRDEIGKPTHERPAHRTVMELVEGRDATTGEFLPNTVMGVLRKSITLGNVIVNQIASPEYQTNLRDSDLFTEEGIARISVTELITVSNRS